MKQAISRFKPYLRWLILGGTLFFLVATLRKHWAGVVQLRIEPTGWAMLTVALGVTLLAHIWSGWVWGWILRELNQPAAGVWAVITYLKTNIAKYLPGNVWHFYGRVMASKEAGFPIGAATLSVLLEPLLMAAAALSIALLCLQSHYQWLQGLGLMVVLAGVHPRILNPLLQIASRIKGKKAIESPTIQSPAIESPTIESSKPSEAPSAPPSSLQIHRYPLRPLLGELLFVVLRGLGFLLTVLVLNSIGWAQVPAIVGAFGLSWLLGLIIPGAPGGIGVFEATALALLGAQLPAAPLLGSIALYRLISTLAEAIGAGLAWLDERQNSPIANSISPTYRD